MSPYDVQLAHSDFGLTERGAGRVSDGLSVISGALRSSWSVPTDTFVTADIPLLLTQLSLIDTRRDP
ncbi:hypothetical protein [uncultured Sphingomonas sp.]|uniref:hypothetical protein n=1 Tax=uncultured Sphingomonas sp. TaxID=158754 RepID=UPI0035CA4DCD